jgi:hypothetical protein
MPTSSPRRAAAIAAPSRRQPRRGRPAPGSAPRRGHDSPAQGPRRAAPRARRRPPRGIRHARRRAHVRRRRASSVRAPRAPHRRPRGGRRRAAPAGIPEALSLVAALAEVELPLPGPYHFAQALLQAAGGALREVARSWPPRSRGLPTAPAFSPVKCASGWPSWRSRRCARSCRIEGVGVPALVSGPRPRRFCAHRACLATRSAGRHGGGPDSSSMRCICRPTPPGGFPPLGDAVRAAQCRRRRRTAAPPRTALAKRAAASARDGEDERAEPGGGEQLRDARGGQQRRGDRSEQRDCRW